MPKRSPASPLAAALAALLLTACATPRAAPPVAPAPVEREELGEAPDLPEEVPAPTGRDLLGGVAYDLPVEANRWVEAELDFLVGQRSAVIGRWLQRGDPYEPFIKEVLRDNGLPTDLYHLAMIESGFVPTVRSRAGAVGLWQFMPATARDVGLRMDADVDERMDPVRSTRAAARHLRGLHRSLRGDWALVAASYNAGQGRVTRSMQKFGATDFWDLAQRGDLAEETRHYVPRLYAMTVIARDRGRFGFAEPAAAERFAFDSVFVEYPTPLAELARIAETRAETLAGLNPHLLHGTTPAGGYWVWVPAGRGAAVQRAWLASDFRREQGHGTYVVRWGDNLGVLAEASGVRAGRIRELNPDVDFDRLRTGEKLKLPFKAAQELAARPARKEDKPEARVAAAAEPAVQPEKSGKPAAEKPAAGKTHTVREGETLWGIARQHGVEVAVLQSLNQLGDRAIRPGDELRLPGRAVLVAEASLQHVVQPGDSLWGIARRYNSTVDAIQGANGLGDRPIRPGQTLTIPR